MSRHDAVEPGGDRSAARPRAFHGIAGAGVVLLVCMAFAVSDRRPSAPGVSSAFHGTLEGAVSAAIGRGDPAFAFRPGSAGSFVAIDGLGLRHILSPTEVTVWSKTGRSWSVGLAAIGRGASRAPVGRARILGVDRNEIRLEQAPVTAWLRNGPLGLEHGWTLARRPAGDGRLTLALAQGGSLRGTATPGGDAVRIGDGLHFSSLHAFDARGRALPARFTAGVGGGIDLVVDDCGAMYPVTVDPVVENASRPKPQAAVGGTLTRLPPAANFAPQLQLHAAGGDPLSRFGFTVALSFDGKTAAIGTNPMSSGAQGTGASGQTYIFARSGSAWAQQFQLSSPGGFAGDGFGSTLALGGDGNTLAIGAPGMNSGQGGVVLFRRGPGGWTKDPWAILTLPASAAPTHSDRLGSAVAISVDGHSVAAGAPGRAGGGAVFIFSGQLLYPSHPLAGVGNTGDQLGSSVSISGNGQMVLAGAPGAENGRGAAYVFESVNGNYNAATKQKLLSSAGAAGDRFGTAVAMAQQNTGVAVIGAPGVAASTGAAYVFNRGSSWVQQQQLQATDAAAGAQFGWSVAFNGPGTTALVGAPAAASQRGSAYTFVQQVAHAGTSWSQQQVGTSAAAGDRLGASLALSSDASIALIGAPLASSASGAAQVFGHAAAGAWTQQQRLTPDADPPGFGVGITVASDGSGAFIGAPGEAGNRGASYFFAHEGGAWTQKQQLQGLEQNGGFGRSVALSADRATAIVAGGDGLHRPVVFTRSGGAWQPQAELQSVGPPFQYLTDPLGSVVAALSADGNTAVLGKATRSVKDGYFVNDRGTASIYVRNNGQWTKQAGLDPGASTDVFALGASVAISADGNVAVVGAPGNPYAAEHDLGIDPRRNGAAYVFARSGTSWNLLRTLAPAEGAAGDRFGCTVAVSADAGTILVGATGAAEHRGAAYIFTPPPAPAMGRSGDTGSTLAGRVAVNGMVPLSGSPALRAGPWEQHVIVDPGATPDDDFGYTLALSQDGATAVIGAPGLWSTPGAAYVFARSGTTWAQQQRLTGPDANHRFGLWVSLSGDARTLLNGTFVFTR